MAGHPDAAPFNAEWRFARGHGLGAVALSRTVESRIPLLRDELLEADPTTLARIIHQA